MSKRSDRDLVGYGNPPKHSRWKPGQSGNPKGRPRGSGRRQMGKIMTKVLGEKVEVTIAGSARWVSQGELAVRGVLKAAIKGNPSAYRAVMDSLPPEILCESEDDRITIIIEGDDINL